MTHFPAELRPTPYGYWGRRKFSQSKSRPDKSDYSSIYRVVVSGQRSEAEMSVRTGDNAVTNTLGPFSELKLDAIPHLLAELKLWDRMGRTVEDAYIEGGYVGWRRVREEAADLLLDWAEECMAGDFKDAPEILGGLFVDQEQEIEMEAAA